VFEEIQLSLKTLFFFFLTKIKPTSIKIKAHGKMSRNSGIRPIKQNNILKNKVASVKRSFLIEFHLQFT